MRRLQVIGQRCLVNRETMILTRDCYVPGIQVLDRMVCTMMAELHLDRLRAAGQREQLMAQADTEYRNIPQQVIDRIASIA